ncbi:MAG TPA: polysaccharide biosynthesis C-terminal domain-containing protein [Flavitalea sp.]|nr:polysaccharide biosynthesis C-terminal domain-containing protein [Flavitalea sp.]HTF28212.1 polysaccharide biosynthesis C-terminal domain-containing protein [Flavitalea sp.]
MSDIRRQSIISSFVVYFGFALGFLNTYLFAREGGFTPEQYGLVGLFIAISNVMYSIANLGMQQYIYKFFPYYEENTEPGKNDMMTWALLTSFMGFVIVMINGIFFKDFIIERYIRTSPEIVTYYYWLFPFGFGLTIFSVLEAFAWQLRKTVFTNFLKEILFRLLTTILIIFSFTKIVSSFDQFIKLYAFTYLAIAGILMTHLLITKKIHFSFRPSKVTIKFRKKIVALVGFVWGGGLIFNISNVFDTLVIAHVMPNGLAFAGVYTLAQNIASLIQAPQRGVISASIAPLSKAWKDKDFDKIKRIYHSSSINQLIFATGMFVIIWINFTDGIFTFGLKKEYLDAKNVFLFIGLMRIMDLGTGVNSQIIGTSTQWRFEFFTGIILLTLTLPLNYFMTKSMGVIGPAISNLIALSIYNGIRYSFLLKKYKMQPFNSKTFLTLLLGLTVYAVCHYLFHDKIGFGWIVLRSSVFVALYLSGVLLMKLSPDILPVWNTLKKKTGFGN